MLAEDEEAWSGGVGRRRFAVRAAQVPGRHLIGGCEVRLRAGDLAEVSYWTFPEHRRRGYATRATRLLCGWAFGELGVRRMEAHVDDDNVASIGVLRNAGFAATGRRDPSGRLLYELPAP